MLNIQPPKVVTDLDRTFALIRHVYGDRERKGGKTPMWLHLALVAEYLLDMGAPTATALGACLQGMFLETHMTMRDLEKFTLSLKAPSDPIHKTVQLFTMMETNVDPMSTMINFIKSNRYPTSVAHIFIANKYIQYGYYDRHNIEIASPFLDNLERGVTNILEVVDDSLILELAAHLGERIDYLRSRPQVLTKKDLTL